MPLFNVFNKFFLFEYFDILTNKRKNLRILIIKLILRQNSRLSTLVLSNLRRYRDLTDTLEGQNSKTMSQKKLIRLQLESHKL